MANVESWLIDAISSHLQEDALLAGELGAPLRLYDEVPEPVQYPYLHFGRHVTRPLDGDGAIIEHDLSLHVWSRFRGRQRGQEVLALVRDSLTGWVPPSGEICLISHRILFADSLRSANGRTVQAVLRLRAITETP